MSSLYEISAEYIRAFEGMDIDPETGEILSFDSIDDITAKFDDKAENVALYIKNTSALSAALKAEEATLKARRDGYDKRVEGLKTYLTNCLDAVGKEKVETSKCLISFRKSSAVNITDESKVPDEYVKVVVSKSPDKTAIKDAIKNGTCVEGAELVERRNIQIK